MALFALISFPLPSKFRRPLLQTLSTPFNSPQVQMVLRCVFVFIGIMFADSVNRTMKVGNELAGDLVTGGVTRAEIQSRKFYSQRNMYLCGFTLFLSLILNRTYKMVFALLAMKEKESKLMNESKVDEKLHEENEKLRLKIKELEKEKENLLKKSKALSDEY
ncbi:hypothetical protein CAS74_001600 [Pichia kudriavzevii]|nr:hypothetical protein JL09_g4046 [Pichia kudriavzevii]OUT23282.1 hypothetical protein CAS74_001600 [Pichia kudriavzevii]